MQKKSEIFKKQNFLGQALDFLPPRKPGLYVSRVDLFFFEYHEQTLGSGQSLSKPVKILISLTKSRIASRCPILNYQLYGYKL